MNSGNIDMGLIAEFNAVIGEEPKELKHYLTGISRSSILQAGAFFLGFKTSKSIYRDYKALIEMFFRPTNAPFKLQMLKQLKKLETESGAKIIIINPASSLTLFQFAFESLTDEETQTKEEVERNIFLAYLALNQLLTSKEAIAGSSSKNAPAHLQLPALFLSQSYPYSDLINYDEIELFTSQLVKAVLLFEYLESTAKTQPLLNAFLQYYECASWKEYLHKVLPIVISVISKEREAHIDINVAMDENFEKNCEFIDKLIIEDGDKVEDYDFKKLRDKPLYKVQPGLYRIISGLFVIEKIFKGLYFKLAEINKTIDSASKLNDLHSIYSDEFSEQTLLYKTLNSIYQNKYIEFNGYEIKKAGLKAEPDYYIRKGNVVFLYESKDFLIRADIKTSYDYNLIEDAFKKKLYTDPSPKAILQLMRNIRRLLKKEFVVDTAYKEDAIYIYPIIVVHDHQYDVVGLNKIVNDWFFAELTKLSNEGINTSRVQPVIIVNIDTIIFNQDLFQDRTLKMEDMIDLYNQHVTLDPKKKYRDLEHAAQYQKRTLIPFAKFVSNFVSSKKLQRIPKMIRDLRFKLF